MRLPKRGEKGFTLIELLIVVAILGVLAAVVIPNVGRFIGRGESEARDAELSNIQSAVTAMMTDNKLPILPYPIDTTQTNDMAAFPDNTSSPTTDGDGDGVMDKLTDPDGYGYDVTTGGDKIGYILFSHDISGNGTTPNPRQTNVNYVATNQTAYWYTVDEMGSVTQYLSATGP